MNARPTFSLRSLFAITVAVAALCWYWQTYGVRSFVGGLAQAGVTTIVTAIVIAPGAGVSVRQYVWAAAFGAFASEVTSYLCSRIIDFWSFHELVPLAGTATGAILVGHGSIGLKQRVLVGMSVGVKIFGLVAFVYPLLSYCWVQFITQQASPYVGLTVWATPAASYFAGVFLAMFNGVIAGAMTGSLIEAMWLLVVWWSFARTAALKAEQNPADNMPPRLPTSNALGLALAAISGCGIFGLISGGAILVLDVITLYLRSLFSFSTGTIHGMPIRDGLCLWLSIWLTAGLMLGIVLLTVARSGFNGESVPRRIWEGVLVGTFLGVLLAIVGLAAGAIVGVWFPAGGLPVLGFRLGMGCGGLIGAVAAVLGGAHEIHLREGLTAH